MITPTLELVECAIDASGLVKTYQNGKVRAVDGVSFAVDRGRIFGLLGSNGAGKSTLIRMLTTLTRPDTGSARIAGFDITRDRDAVRSAIGVVGQKHGSDPDSTGLENLMLQGHLHGWRGRGLRTRVDELVEQFGLGAAARRVVGDYSGGMQRRLDIAMGLVHGPSVLFLDEPTTGLDPEIRIALWEEITRLNSQEKLTIVLTTHYLEEADKLADRVAIIDRGRIVAEGPPEELKAGVRGDALTIEVSDTTVTESVVPALRTVPGLNDITLTNCCVRARTVDGARAIPGVLGTLERAGVQVVSVAVTRPSLDDVFLRITGQSLTRDQNSAEEAS